MSVRRIDDASGGLRVARLVGALLVVAAIVQQLFVVYDQPHPAPLKLFSFFTIQANLIAAGLWAYGAWRPSALAGRPLLRGAATSYLLITGLVYFVLSWDPNKDQLLELTAWWVNALTHQVLPLAILAEWILAPPDRRISLRTALLWLLYPIAFFAYSMIRGYLSGWYPYPFLIPGYWGGYSGVAVNALVVLAMMLPVVLAVAWIGSRRAGAGAGS